MKNLGETKNKINQLEPQTLLAHGIIRLVPDKTDEYICPLCGNGSSGNRDATGIKPKIYPDHVGWKCHRCGGKFDNIAIFATHYGISDKTDFKALVEKICDNFNLPFLSNVTPLTPEKKSEVNPAVLNIINQDLATDIQPLKNFVDQCGGVWRGLPFTILEKFGCRYIENWTHPKARAAQKFSTPTPRMIIPANADGLHSNYIARLTLPLDSFDETAQKYIEEKKHAGSKTLFNFDALNSNEPVFVVEGYVDAMTLEFAGFRAVATGGADSFNLLVEAVKPLEKKPDVVILFDPDDTGRLKAPQLKNALADVGCRAVIEFLTADVSKTDANSILQEQGIDYLANDLFAIEQEAKKDFEAKSESAKEPPEIKSEKSATKKKRESLSKKKTKPNAMKLSFDEKKFLYSGGFSDVDFARRIEFMYGEIIRYLQDENAWLILDKNNQGGGVWKNRGEKKAVIEPYALELADALLANAVPIPEPLVGDLTKIPKEKRDEHKKQSDFHDYQVKLSAHLSRQKNISQAVECMKGSWNLIIHPEDLNKPKHLLNVLNGVIDLKTGEFLPLDPDYLIMNQAGAAYNPDADTAFVEKVLADILPDDDTRRAVLRYLGYCLTGMKNYHISEFWRGQAGANGKSTLIDFVTKVFGSYAKKLPTAGLLESRRPVDGNSPTPAIAQLDGDIRLAIIDELPRNVRLDAALYKTLTGDEFVYSRAMYCNPRMIELRAKFIINGNHLPTFDVDDGGLERRITTIPFNQKFTGARADNKLSEKLSTPENLSALLKILVEEARLYYTDGLLESEEMREAKEAYFEENDFVRNFLVENCITGHGGEITRKTLEEKIFASYPRECSRLKKKELLDLIISRLEPYGAFYTKNKHTKHNVFANIKWLEDSND